MVWRGWFLWGTPPLFSSSGLEQLMNAVHGNWSIFSFCTHLFLLTVRINFPPPLRTHLEGEICSCRHVERTSYLEDSLLHLHKRTLPFWKLASFPPPFTCGLCSIVHASAPSPQDCDLLSILGPCCLYLRCTPAVLSAKWKPGHPWWVGLCHWSAFPSLSQ